MALLSVAGIRQLPTIGVDIEATSDLIISPLWFQLLTACTCSPVEGLVSALRRVVSRLSYLLQPEVLSGEERVTCWKSFIMLE